MNYRARPLPIPKPEKTMPFPAVSVIIHSPPTCGATFVQTQIIAALTALGLNVSAPPGNLGRREVKNRTENPERFVDALRAKGVSVVVEVRQVPRGKKL